MLHTFKSLLKPFSITAVAAFKHFLTTIDAHSFNGMPKSMHFKHLNIHAELFRSRIVWQQKAKKKQKRC